jgi:hypothetical protein
LKPGWRPSNDGSAAEKRQQDRERRGAQAKAHNVEDVASLKKTLPELAKAEVMSGQCAQLLLSRLTSLPLW